MSQNDWMIYVLQQMGKCRVTREQAKWMIDHPPAHVYG